MTFTINLSVLDNLVENFPIGAEVENLFERGTVIGYHYNPDIGYSGNLILRGLGGEKWIANPNLCEKVG